MRETCRPLQLFPLRFFRLLMTRCRQTIVWPLLAIALVSLPIGGMALEEIVPGYAWHELGNGVYVHARTDPLAGPVDGNSVIVVNDCGVLVIDTHINPAVARAVIDKIRSITEQPVTLIVNTHWHDDHANGNYAYRQAFPDVRIIAHEATLQALRKEWQAMEDNRRAAYATVDIEQLLGRAAELEATDAMTAIGYRVYAGYVAALRPELDALELEYPDTVFEDSLAYELGERRVEIRWLGRGNTDGDVVVWLPDDRILVTGDLLVAPIPFAFESPMADWGGALRRLGDLNPEIIIPGHGLPQHDDHYLDAVRALIEDTTGRVREAHDEGVEFAELANAVDLAEYRSEFAGEDAWRQWAWQNYFVTPGLKSAWTSLGYPLPSD